MNKSLISASELHTKLLTSQDFSTSPKLLFVLYTTMQSGPGVRPDIVKANPHTYIPNSIFFDLQGDFSDSESDLSNTMISFEMFEEKARALGINHNHEIIVYDDFGNFCASRVWFMFKAMGHQKVKVLDGGLPEWLLSGLPTESLSINNANKNTHSIGNFTAQPNAKFRFVDKTFVLNNTKTKNIDLIDARSHKRFLGEEQESKASLRSGHIPHSTNLHYASLQTDNGKFVEDTTLQDLFASYSKDTLLFSCGSGITACILAQGAYICGCEHLLVYDGSWSEWGRAPTPSNSNDMSIDQVLPIETGKF